MYDRVGDGAWRIARRRSRSDEAARDVVVQGFLSCANAGRYDDVDLLRCVLEHAKRVDPTPPRAAGMQERRRSSDTRDAFELIYVGGARVADVARAFGLTTYELSGQLADSVRGHRSAAPS